MDVRAGYKRTKLGWIPEEWETATIGDVSEKIVGGGTPSREKPEYYNGSIPWLTVKDLSENSFYKSSTLESISETAIKESSANLIPKDNVIISTRMALGKGFINKMDIAINQDMKALFLDKSVATNEFFLYWYRSKSILFEKMGSGTTVKGIALKALKNVLLPLPPIPEQKKLADILTTVDDKIASIEDRIQQTEQLKKGLMEKLLTEGIGHTEFKDTKIGRIPASWNVFPTGEVYEKSVELGNRSYPIASISIEKSIVRRETINRQLISDLPPEKHLLVKKGYLAYNMMRMWQGASGIADFDCLVSPAYVVCQPIRKVFPKYSSYYFKSPKNIILLKRFSKGITEDRWRLYYNDFSKIPFIMPPYNEQKEIASILSTVDDKLHVLRSKKIGYETLKKGLMEQLLSGKRRVKV